MRATRTPFIVVPVWVAEGTTPIVMSVYLALCQRSLIDRKPPKGTKWIMEASGMGRTAVYDALASLRAIGAIVTDGDDFFLPVDPPGSSAHTDTGSAHADDPSAVADTHLSIPEIEDSLSGVDTPGPFTRADGIPVALNALPLGQYPPEFEKTWGKYPKGRRLEKRGVYGKWRATIERECKATKRTPIEVMRYLYWAVVHYAKSRTGTDDTFTMHPSRFFGPGEPWRDWLEATPAAAYEKKAWEA